MSRSSPGLGAVAILRGFSCLSVPVLCRFGLLGGGEKVFGVNPTIRCLFGGGRCVGVPGVCRVAGGGARVCGGVNVGLVSSVKCRVGLGGGFFVNYRLGGGLKLAGVVGGSSRVGCACSVGTAFLTISLGCCFWCGFAGGRGGYTFNTPFFGVVWLGWAVFADSAFGIFGPIGFGSVSGA